MKKLGSARAIQYARNVILLEPSAITLMSRHFRENPPTDRFQLAGWLTYMRHCERSLRQRT